MEEKKVIKINLSTFLLLLAIVAIIVMGIFIYKLNNAKTIEIQKSTELQEQVNSLNKTISNLQEIINSISATISSTNEVSNSIVKENDIKDIILDGKYAYAGYIGDISWDFSKDGKAAFGGNMFVNQGTYKTIKENYIEIHYTKSKTWDDETGDVTIDTIDKYEYISIDNKNNIYLIDSNGKKEKIERFADVVEEQFN